MSKMNGTIKTRIDENLKKSVEKKLEMLGLDTPTVIRMLFSHIDNFNKIPSDLFNIPHIPNEETLKAIKDVEEGKNLSKGFNTIEELRKELE